MVVGRRNCERSEQLRVKEAWTNKYGRKMLSVNFLPAIYFLHLQAFSCKNSRLCRECLMLLEYYQKIGTFCLYQRF
jgi:hypothetical protein